MQKEQVTRYISSYYHHNETESFEPHPAMAALERLCSQVIGEYIDDYLIIKAIFDHIHDVSDLHNLITVNGILEIVAIIFIPDDAYIKFVLVLCSIACLNNTFSKTIFEYMKVLTRAELPIFLAALHDMEKAREERHWGSEGFFSTIQVDTYVTDAEVIIALSDPINRWLLTKEAYDVIWFPYAVFIDLAISDRKFRLTKEVFLYLVSFAQQENPAVLVKQYLDDLEEHQAYKDEKYLLSKLNGFDKEEMAIKNKKQLMDSKLKEIDIRLAEIDKEKFMLDKQIEEIREKEYHCVWVLEDRVSLANIKIKTGYLIIQKSKFAGLKEIFLVGYWLDHGKLMTKSLAESEFDKKDLLKPGQYYRTRKADPMLFKYGCAPKTEEISIKIQKLYDEKTVLDSEKEKLLNDKKWDTSDDDRARVQEKRLLYAPHLEKVQERIALKKASKRIPCADYLIRLNKTGYTGDIPDEFICPISAGVMTNPVYRVVRAASADGSQKEIRQYYDYDNIVKCLLISSRCPVMRVPMKLSELKFDLLLKAKIESFVVSKESELQKIIMLSPMYQAYCNRQLQRSVVFFNKLKYGSRHTNPAVQHELDKQGGLVLRH